MTRGRLPKRAGSLDLNGIGTASAVPLCVLHTGQQKPNEFSNINSCQLTKICVNEPISVNKLQSSTFEISFNITWSHMRCSNLQCLFTAGWTKLSMSAHYRLSTENISKVSGNTISRSIKNDKQWHFVLLTTGYITVTDELLTMRLSKRCSQLFVVVNSLPCSHRLANFTNVMQSN